MAELWIGLLKFFTEDFNFKDYVVCIRQHKPLTRFEKLWNGKGLAIEGVCVKAHVSIYGLFILSDSNSDTNSNFENGYQRKATVGIGLVIVGTLWHGIIKSNCTHSLNRSYSRPV